MQKITLKQAKKNGLKTYFTGKPCKWGHVCERYSHDRSCVLCRTKDRLEVKAKIIEEKNNPKPKFCNDCNIELTLMIINKKAACCANHVLKNLKKKLLIDGCHLWMIE